MDLGRCAKAGVVECGDNTWIFGERFHITMPEAGLARVMERVSEDLGQKRAGRNKVRKLDGTAGRVDCFLGRSVPHPADRDMREYLLVELKRPSLTIGRAELDQLEDYVKAIRAQPDFSHTLTTWNFYLVTGKYDEAISHRVRQKGRPIGCVWEEENSKVWVETCAELTRECEGRLAFIRDKLRIQVSDDEIEAKLTALKASVL